MINPIEVYRNSGEEKLRAELKKLEAQELQAIIKKYMPDSTRKIYRSKNTTEDIINYIVYRASKLAVKGLVFMS